MRNTYRISSVALEDIEKIFKYTLENGSLKQANHYFRLIYQEIDFICDDFESGKDIGNIKPGYKQFRVKSHLIICKKDEDGVVHVIRVLHQMMDIQNQIK